MDAQAVDILIVGAGIAGASTAYHLARRSAFTVAVIEKEATPGAHSTGRNASFIRERTEEEKIRPLAKQGAEFLRSGELAEYAPNGSIIIGWGNEDASRYCPVARGKGLWCPGDGIVDVAALLQSYLLGQRVILDTEVLDWRQEGERLAVRTSRGQMTCRVLVNAAGPWAGRLGRLPIMPKKRHLFVTPPMAWVDPRWPFVWDAEGGVYFRPESGGLLLSACDESPSEPGDYSEDSTVAALLAERLAERQPDLKDISIQRSWAGHRTFAPDRLFVIGFDPRDERVFHVAGLGGHGVTTSHAVGKLAAEMILGDASNEFAAAFSPRRLL